ncbi:MAG: radical SAM protein [Rhodospirillales bacterium]|nr:radical SAM protein [Rhodospirillales bacterium]
MKLTYDAPVYRPPSEARSLIIQATIGCSFDGCTFCSMYKSKDYRARPLEAVFADIATAARFWPEARRVFLADGDAVVLPTADLVAILDRLAGTFPRLERVSAYATPMALNAKPMEDLARLRDKGLSLVYLGIESGSASILKRIRKGATPATMARALDAARGAGLAVSATVILGLGGRRLWTEHVDATADLINRAPPTFLSTLQLRLDADVRDDFLSRFSRDGVPFEEQDDAGILAEQERLLAALDPPAPVIFRSNHASNCLALAGTLPDDRAALLALIAAARAGAPLLRPQSLRGL